MCLDVADLKGIDLGDRVCIGDAVGLAGRSRGGVGHLRRGRRCSTPNRGSRRESGPPSSTASCSDLSTRRDTHCRKCAVPNGRRTAGSGRSATPSNPGRTITEPCSGMRSDAPPASASSSLRRSGCSGRPGARRPKPTSRPSAPTVRARAGSTRMPLRWPGSPCRSASTG